MKGCAVRREEKARFWLAEETGRALHVVWLLQEPVFLHVEAVSRLLFPTCLRRFHSALTGACEKGGREGGGGGQKRKKLCVSRTLESENSGFS